MDISRYTSTLQESIAKSKEIAKQHKNNLIEVLHLVLAIVEKEHSPIISLLTQAKVNFKLFRNQLLSEIDILPKISNLDSIKISRDLSRNLNETETLANNMGDKFVSSDLFIVKVASQPGTTSQLLVKCGLDVELLQRNYQQQRGNEKIESSSHEESKNALQRFTVDLTAKAEEGLLDPVVGRDDEIRRVIQILRRRRKNNPILIGDPGVGKTAIIEGLAQRIVNNQVPEVLRGKQILSLDMGALIAGAKMRGEFEERIKSVLKDLSQQDGQIILFIDEIHTMVGTGKSDGAMDAGNMLKPALSRGELRCLGSTTLDEYREYIERDPALERRFQKILVEEPPVDETIAILRGLKERYEVHHGIEITDEAIVSAAKLSHRYITDRKLPDKAIDLIDEAGSWISTEIQSKPEAVDKVERRLIQLKMEEEVLKKDTGSSSKDRLSELKEQIGTLEAEFKSLNDLLTEEKDYTESIRKAKSNLEQAKIEMDAARRSGNLGRMSEIQYGEIPKLEELIKNFETNPKEMELIRTKVSDEEIAEVVSKATGIPVNKMLEGEKEKLMKLESLLHEKVIGQNQAIDAVSHAVRRARAGLSDPNKPSGSFLFLGPTGVGKTELCKALAKFLFDSEEAMVRLDMSEFMEKHSVARLIGAPPGYVGYEEGGRLTEAIRRRPYSLVLFDEVEKAHGDVFNILLQVLDDGRLTDSMGRLVDFKNTVIVLTSNLGSDKIQDLYGNLKKTPQQMLEEAKQQALESTNANQPEQTNQVVEQNEDIDVDTEPEKGPEVDYNVLKGVVMAVVEKHFRPEFLNRIDEVVVFHPLSKAQIRNIAHLQINHLRGRLQEQNIDIELTDKAMDLIIEYGYDPAYGARPLRRTVQKWLENPLAQYIISGIFTEGMVVHVDTEGDALSFSA